MPRTIVDSIRGMLENPKYNSANSHKTSYLPIKEKIHIFAALSIR